MLVHLSALYAVRDMVVSRGELIGQSGRASIEHIHLEVRHNGKQTDTRGWFGGGEDPCPAGPGPDASGYRGCEPSIWLWADETPPASACTPMVAPGEVSRRAMRYRVAMAQPIFVPLVAFDGTCAP